VDLNENQVDTQAHVYFNPPQSFWTNIL